MSASDDAEAQKRASFRLGLIHLSTGALQKSSEDFQKVEQIDNQFFSAQLSLRQSQLLLRQGKIEDAIFKLVLRSSENEVKPMDKLMGLVLKADCYDQ